MKNFIFKSIDEILQNGSAQLAVPLHQRAKFEGWLKIELAAKLHSVDTDTKIEVPYPQCRSRRTDIVSKGYFIELKTVNTNCSFLDIPKKYKPFSKNVQKCVDDIKKIRQYKGTGIVAFVFFPVKDPNRLSIVNIKSEILPANFVDGMSCGSYYIFVAEI